jgi:hypothetical protein
MLTLERHEKQLMKWNRWRKMNRPGSLAMESAFRCFASPAATKTRYPEISLQHRQG